MIQHVKDIVKLIPINEFNLKQLLNNLQNRYNIQLDYNELNKLFLIIDDDNYMVNLDILICDYGDIQCNTYNIMKQLFGVISYKKVDVIGQFLCINKYQTILKCLSRKRVELTDDVFKNISYDVVVKDGLQFQQDIGYIKIYKDFDIDISDFKQDLNTVLQNYQQQVNLKQIKLDVIKPLYNNDNVSYQNKDIYDDEDSIDFMLKAYDDNDSDSETQAFYDQVFDFKYFKKRKMNDYQYMNKHRPKLYLTVKDYDQIGKYYYSDEDTKYDNDYSDNEVTSEDSKSCQTINIDDNDDLANYFNKDNHKIDNNDNDDNEDYSDNANNNNNDNDDDDDNNKDSDNNKVDNNNNNNNDNSDEDDNERFI